LVALGVRFVHNAASRLDPPAIDPTQPPHLRPRAQITLADGARVAPDYTVVAVDAPAAEYITSALRVPAAPWPGWTGSPPSRPHPTVPCNPTRPGPSGGGIPTRWRNWDGCRGIGSKRCAASSITSTRHFSCSEDTCCTRARNGV